MRSTFPRLVRKNALQLLLAGFAGIAVGTGYWVVRPSLFPISNAIVLGFCEHNRCEAIHMIVSFSQSSRTIWQDFGREEASLVLPNPQPTMCSRPGTKTIFFSLRPIVSTFLPRSVR